MKPWPPSAMHYHGFDRAVIQWIPHVDDSDSFPVAMVDGIEAHRTTPGLFDKRRKEWYDWWTACEIESHSCRPTSWCILASFGEVIRQAKIEGCELPSWIIPNAEEDKLHRSDNDYIRRQFAITIAQMTQNKTSASPTPNDFDLADWCIKQIKLVRSLDNYKSKN